MWVVLLEKKRNENYSDISDFAGSSVKNILKVSQRKSFGVGNSINFLLSVLMSASFIFLIIYFSAAGTPQSHTQLPVSLASCSSTLLANLAS